MTNALIKLTMLLFRFTSYKTVIRQNYTVYDWY